MAPHNEVPIQGGWDAGTGWEPIQASQGLQPLSCEHGHMECRYCKRAAANFG